MECPSCGNTQNRSLARFCDQCGNALPVSYEPGQMWIGVFERVGKGIFRLVLAPGEPGDNVLRVVDASSFMDTAREYFVGGVVNTDEQVEDGEVYRVLRWGRLAYEEGHWALNEAEPPGETITVTTLEAE